MVSILPEGKPLWGGPCQRVEVEEVDLRPCGVKGGEKNDPEDPDAWEAEIGKAGFGGAFVFSDGSLLESGNVRGGAFVVGMDGREQEVECGVGDVATVWDGEIAGMAGGLSQARTMQGKE